MSQKTIKNDLILGLDIGSTSIGWSLRSDDKVIAMGTRLFSNPRDPKGGESLAVARRGKRSLRRQIRRKRLRKNDALDLFVEKGLVKAETPRDKEKRALLFRSHTEKDGVISDPLSLREKGLRELLSPLELAKILYYFIGHRGFKSNKKNPDKKSDEGALLKGMGALKERFEESGCETLGEFLHSLRSQDGEKVRNSEGNYTFTPSHELLKEELHILFVSQRRFESAYASIELEDKFIEIFDRRRSYASGPGKPSRYGGDLIAKMVGRGTFEPHEKRASKGSYDAILFRALEKVRNLSVVRLEGGEISNSEREALFQKFLSLSGSMSYAQARSVLGLGDEDRFKGVSYSRELGRGAAAGTPEWKQLLKDAEKKNIIDLKVYGAWKKAIGSKFCEASRTALNQAAFILTCYEGDGELKKLLSKIRDSAGRPFFESQEIEALIASEASFKGFIHLSCKALGKINPIWRNDWTLTYDKACQAAGYDPFKVLDQIKRTEITNPTVFRGVQETIKLYKALEREYGEPNQLYMEFARDLSISQKDKKKLQKEMDDNRSKKERVFEMFKEEHGRAPRKGEVLALRLYEEQGGRCLYCGTELSLDTLGDSQIEHTRPYSRSLDDSYSNKTASCTTCNQNKQNLTPYEWIGGDAERWQAFTERVWGSYVSSKKREILLSQESDFSESASRQINDTRYIARVMHRYFRGQLSSEDGHLRVFAVKGRATAKARRMWGLEELKYDKDHERTSQKNHALDALVISCLGPRQVQFVSNASRQDWLNSEEDFAQERFKQMFPEPWGGFREEVNDLMTQEDERGCPIVFVSRAPSHKVRATVNKDTLLSNKLQKRDPKAKLVKRVSLAGLTPGQIAGLYEHGLDEDFLGKCDLAVRRQWEEEMRKRFGEKKWEALAAESGERCPTTPLYEKLKRRCSEGKEAFKRPFYKNGDEKGDWNENADGERKGQLPIPVKRLSMRVNVKGIPVGDGMAERGDMVRTDIFEQDGKTYFTPLYAGDRGKELPLQVCTATKEEKDWKSVKEESFRFSLFSGDLVLVKERKTEGAGRLLYYYGADRANSALKFFPIDAEAPSKELIRVVAQGLEIQKMAVDRLGHVFRQRASQKRQALSAPGEKG